MVESIKELRKICEPKGGDHGLYAKFNRKTGIYFIWLLLHTKISPGQVTLFQLLYLPAAALFSFGVRAYSLIAILVMHMACLTDYMDGGIARYRKTCSFRGVFLDYVVSRAGRGSLFIGITFGIYNQYHNISIFFFGFLTVLFYILLNDLELYDYPILVRMKEQRAKLSEKEEIDNPEKITSEGNIKHFTLLKKIYYTHILTLLRFDSMMVMILIATIFNRLDLFIIGYGLLLLIIFCLKAYFTYRKDFKRLESFFEILIEDKNG